MKAFLILEDGTVLTGESFGAAREVISEVVFNTSMTGYLEVMTDPSYAGQAVCMTYPLIGNYGFSYEDQDSRKPWIDGFIVRELSRIPSNFRSVDTIQHFLEKHDIPGIAGIDTRALTKILREKGTMNGMITVNENYNLDEKVSVSASADGGVDYYGVQVWKGDKVVYQESFTANKLDIDCSKLGAGDYGVFVSCVNNYGSINTETVQFHVTSGITNDIDLDNSVTVADATLLQKYVVGIATLTDDQKLLADCNGDGAIDVRDATYIQKTIVKIPE